MFGIGNCKTKRFVYGIKENSKNKAGDNFRKIYPNKYIPGRYEVKEIPKDGKNPKNILY